MFSRSCAVALLLAAVVAPACFADVCQQQEMARAADRARNLQIELLAVSVADMDTDVAPELQQKIHALKEALTEYTDDYFACMPASEIDTGVTDSVLRGAVAPANSASQPGGTTHTGVDGADISATVVNNDAHRDVVSVQWTFGISCGIDSFLLVYQEHAGSWQRVLRWQAGDYKEISGAFGDFFQYALVPRPGGAWAIAVAHGMPWCSSRMSAFDIDLLAPAGNGNAQKTEFHQHGYYSRDNLAPVMKPWTEGFDLRLEVDMLDLGLLVRKGVYRYRTTGDKLERVQPVAMSGRDFVDEWLQVDWTEAAKWSNLAQIAPLKIAHEKIAAARQSKDTVLITYGAVRRCTDAKNHYQVEVEEDPGGMVYFQIAEGNNSYTMLSASEQADAHCTGANLMPNK